jgi:hypothetical protein
MESFTDLSKLAIDIRYDQITVIDSWSDGHNHELVVHPSVMSNLDELEAWIMKREGVRSILRREQT